MTNEQTRWAWSASSGIPRGPSGDVALDYLRVSNLVTKTLTSVGAISKNQQSKPFESSGISL